MLSHLSLSLPPSSLHFPPGPSGLISLSHANFSQWSPSLHHLWFLSVFLHVHILYNNKIIYPEQAHGHPAGPLLLTVGSGPSVQGGLLPLRQPGAFPRPFPRVAKALLGLVSVSSLHSPAPHPWPSLPIPPSSVRTVAGLLQKQLVSLEITEPFTHPAKEAGETRMKAGETLM